jgi:hypothetical protein
MTDPILVAKLLRRKRCDLWPDCCCNKTLLHWQDRLPYEEFELTLEQLSWAETSVFLALSCIAAHCPQRRVRAYAEMQLIKPWWDRQRRLETIEDLAEKEAGEQ